MNSNLRNLGWNDSFQQQLESFSQNTCYPARVIREDRGRFLVDTGEEKAAAQLAGSFLGAVQSSLDHPTIGDWVLVDPTSHSGASIIYHVLERKSLFSRQHAGTTSDEQLIAANIDYLFIVSGLDQNFNPGRIQRYLTQAWNSGAQPVIILNKSDLVHDPDRIIDDLRAQIPDTPVHAVSALFGNQMDSLAPYLKPGITIALSGSSGVGKSSLINVLLGDSRLKTQSNREDDNRGRHTTTWRELISLRSGPCLIDLPGMRELKLTGDSTGFSKAFADIHDLARQCRFRNCTHQHEPGCAVQEAVQDGSLPSSRLARYRKLEQENSEARKRGKARKQKPAPSNRKREEKEAFFKDIAIRKRKASKAGRKFRHS